MKKWKRFMVHGTVLADVEVLLMVRFIEIKTVDGKDTSMEDHMSDEK